MVDLKCAGLPKYEKLVYDPSLATREPPPIRSRHWYHPSSNGTVIFILAIIFPEPTTLVDIRIGQFVIIVVQYFWLRRQVQRWSYPKWQRALCAYAQ